MSKLWFECDNCVYATNSEAKADEHDEVQGHSMQPMFGSAEDEAETWGESK